MRKQFKKALSMVLSAAMVLTLGSGFELKSAKAADVKTCKVTFNDAQSKKALEMGTINGDGTYTLKYEGSFSVSESEPSSMYLQFGENDGVEITTAAAIKDVSVKADGVSVGFTKAPEIMKDGKKVQVMFFNSWGGNPWDGSNPVTILENGKSALNFEESLEVTFTLEGFWEAPTPETSAGPSSKPGASTDPSASPSSKPAVSAGPSTEPSEEPGGGFGPYDAMLNISSLNEGPQYWGPDNSSNTEGLVAYDTVAESEEDGCQGKVALDLRQTEVGYSELMFMAFMINGAEAEHSDYAIRLDAMKINGESVDDALLAKAYTCSDNGTDTRVNIYNAWCPEDNAVTREDARTYGTALEDTSPTIIGDYVDEEVEFQTVELAFTYGSPEYINATDPQDLEDSIIEDPAGPSSAPSVAPSNAPSGAPSNAPSVAPSNAPSVAPSNAPSVAPSNAPSVAPSNAPSVAPSNAPGTGAATGSQVSAGGSSYKVTGSSTVEYSAPKKNATSVKVPDTVKVNGKTYKVTTIKAKAFANNKKLKSVTIGKNIKKIGNQAFFKCPKLTKITFKGTKAPSIGSKAFAKGAKKPTVTTPKKMKKKVLNGLKKKLKKAGLSKKAKYKKK